MDPTRAFSGEAAPGQPDPTAYYGQPGQAPGGFGQPYGTPDASTPPGGAASPYAPPAGAPSPYTPAAGAPSPYAPPAEAPDPYAPAAGAPDPYTPPAHSHTPGGGYATGANQAYGQPPYGVPPAYGAPAYGAVKPTNTLAILSLVFAFVFPVAGVVMGHLAKRQIRDSGEEGGGLATAGLAIGYAFTAVGLLLCVGYGVLIAVAFTDGATGTF
ncbi:DUF4190 domain-containing protein [Actinoplanes sp. TBRC 11911]|nr:DUF4190 domain-containing protein [Actinoplanes sp. TBRC 11911]